MESFHLPNIFLRDVHNLGVNKVEFKRRHSDSADKSVREGKKGGSMFLLLH